jgi:SAM-dependent methyltransferase
MNTLPLDPWEPIRQQFDQSPYPRVPLDRAADEKPEKLYSHNLVTPYYARNRRVVDPKGKLILDAGCGSGYKSLMLAAANPGAKVVGIDLSAPSIDLARQRLEYHGYDNVEFHVLSLEDLPKLNQQFDYINCDDTLYLLPDPIAGLQSMKAVLQSDGVLRVNFHSVLQRFGYFRAQKISTLLDLMTGEQPQQDMATMRAMMQALKPGVFLKEKTWNADYETDDQALLANHLLRGDKGLTIPEFFALLQTAGLAFIRMVDWQSWNLMDVFDTAQLPTTTADSLAAKPVVEQLHLYELFQPSHRLLDLWCGHPQTEVPPAVGQWQSQDWQQATVHLHPQLKTTTVRDKVRTCALTLRPFRPSHYLPLPGAMPQLEGVLAACLLPLWRSPQPFAALVARWQQIHPVNPVTLLPTQEAEAFKIVQEMVRDLEHLGYLLLEPAA